MSLYYVIMSVQGPIKKRKENGWETDDESSGIHEGKEMFSCPVCGAHIGYMGEVFSDDDETSEVDKLWESSCIAWADQKEMDLEKS